MFESILEDIAQTTNEIDYNDAWVLNAKAEKNTEFCRKVQGYINDYERAVASGDEDAMFEAGKQLSVLACEC